ncbi:MAG: hypothetical protein E7304_12365 [Butyrivibrio sp.]|uniref:hypothetical protein n=1 Tax=Butyrivibrio sp. TaxID=28121 RepID=UPI001ED45085|nr:hypothetical protein [Butyrivibrio sp.]MBE5842183.1 hypothetical protein [Butyrivibrio sp.]
MKKKFLTAIIIAAMTVSLVACGSSATEETTVATETSEVVETTETTETVESSATAEEIETTEELVETETTAAVEETESLAAETKKATEKTTENATEKQQAATNNTQPSTDNSANNNNIQYNSEGVATSGVPDGVTTQDAIAKANAMGYDIGVVHQAEDGHYYCYYIESGWPTEPGTSLDLSYGSGTFTDISVLSDYMTLRRCDFY